MKKELFELLPPETGAKKETRGDVEVVEDFFKNSEELKQAIVFEEEGVYSILNDILKKIECPIKRKNGKNYWEAFFILLGFEYYKVPRKSKVYLIIR